MKAAISCQTPQFDYQFNSKDKGIIGVYGISGSGKSSLLDALAGYNDKVKGSIQGHKRILLDTDNRHYPEVHKCCYMQQNPVMFPHWTVLQHLAFIQQHNTPLTDGFISQDELLTSLNCQHLLNKYPQQLSGGEKQRIVYILTLLQINKNSLVLLDEPFSALDHKLRKKALKLLRAYKSQCLIFFISHDIAEIYAIADELLYVHDGKITLHNSINDCMHSAHNNLPIASKIRVNNKRQVIYADDVSINYNHDKNSSIIHQIDAIITGISSNEDTSLIQLAIDNHNSEHKQILYAKITLESLQRLDLSINQTVVANFKASSFLD
jgi:molybdate transport system ATP-binding protein